MNNTEQISPRKENKLLATWKKGVSGNIKERYTCAITNICIQSGKKRTKDDLPLSIFNGINTHCHHLYCYELYPTLRYSIQNGILLNSVIHTCYHSFHNLAFKNQPITPNSFLAFCSKLQNDNKYTFSILNQIFTTLEDYFCLNDLDYFSQSEHPKTKEMCYKVYLDLTNHPARRYLLIPVNLVTYKTDSNLYVKNQLKKVVFQIEKNIKEGLLKP